MGIGNKAIFQDLKSEDEERPIAELLLRFHDVGISSESENEQDLQDKLKEISKRSQHLQRKQHYIMESGTVKQDLKDWILNEQSNLVHDELEIKINNSDPLEVIQSKNDDPFSSDYEIEIVPEKKLSKNEEIRKIMRQNKKRVNLAQQQGWKESKPDVVAEEKEDERPITTLEDLEERDWEAEEKAGLQFMKKLLQENREEQDKKLNWDYKADDDIAEADASDEDMVDAEQLESASDNEQIQNLHISKNVIDSDSDDSIHSDNAILTNIAPTLQLTNVEISQEPEQINSFFPSTLKFEEDDEDQPDKPLSDHELDPQFEQEILQQMKDRESAPKPTLSEWAGIAPPVEVAKASEEEVNKYLEKEAQISEDELGFGEGDDEMNTDDELNEFHDDLKLDLQNNENASKGVERVKKLHRKQVADTDKQQTVDLLKDLTAGTLGMTREQKLALKEKGFAIDQEHVDFELLELEQNRKNRKRKKKDAVQWGGPQSLSHFGISFLI